MSCLSRETVFGSDLIHAFRKTIPELCCLVRASPAQVKAVILVEADDFIIASDFGDKLKRFIGKRSDFYEWEADKAECAGQSFSPCPSKDRIGAGQEKCIMENLFPIHVSLTGEANEAIPLTPAEFKEHRYVLYKLNWIIKESRPGLLAQLPSWLPGLMLPQVEMR